MSQNTKTVELDEDEKCIFIDDPTEKIRILNEELGYNKDYKPYRILILERPLDSRSKRKSTSEPDDSTNSSSLQTTHTECRTFLRSFTEFSKILQSLDDQLKQFNTNYMILKDYLDDARSRLHNMSLDVVEKCYKCSKQMHKQDPKFKDVLSSSVESYVMAAVYQKIFGVMCEKFSSEDRQLLDKCKQLQDVQQEQLGVSPEFCCPQPMAVVELANIDCLCTPLEKLHCLKSTVDTATETISTSLEDNVKSGILDEDKPCLTSDDLIPILVTIIAQAKCSHLFSNMFYIEHFHWSRDTKDRDNLSYCLVTFRAAMEYMTNTNFDHLQNGKSKVLKEISIEELKNVTREISLSQLESSSHNAVSRDGNSSTSKLDRQLQKISKIIDESTAGLSSKTSASKKEPTSVFGDMYQYLQKTPEVPKQENKKKKEQLGSFLNSLEDDIFDQCFGKQS